MNEHERQRPGKAVGYVLVWCLLAAIVASVAVVGSAVTHVRRERQRLTDELETVREEIREFDPMLRHLAFVYQGRTTHLQLIANAEAELLTIETRNPPTSGASQDSPSDASRVAALRGEIAERRAAVARLDALNRTGMHVRMQRLRRRVDDLQRRLDTLPW